ncbi:hypothetical protein SADUNF_Sadunf03G0128800 [Salix dunnii]|uniref:BAG domain-containing protein n=1 Tax=Salix dunnii TaxID=1413687 RepID=A0A835N4J8_9ROSI|nr:hypothetical protein SADUNF_Sadunf03G0128800 [Salix dunnii]
MDAPFYRIPRNYPSSSPQIPVHHRPTTVLPKKVVSIPVRYVGSERSRSESAIKIQKVLRGFLVRKSMKKILATKRQVDEIEERVLMEETADLVRRDQKEKLKINEMLMSLLLKLDSVRGVDVGVRDCRKAVIKKAIALQETVDSFAAATAPNGDDTDDSAAPAGEKGVDETGEGEEESGNVANAVDELQNGAAEPEAVVSMLADSREAGEELNGALENVEMCCEGERNVECDGDVPTPMSDYCEPERVLEVINETVELREAENDETACQGEDGDLEKQVDKDGDCVGTSQTESQTDSSASLLEGDEEDEEDSGGVEIEKKGDEGEVKSKDESTRSKELLEKMVEDNERMMGLMAELFERNEMQTRLLSSLSQRVEQLERAYICDQLRRRKKRNAAGLVDFLELTPKKL